MEQEKKIASNPSLCLFLSPPANHGEKEVKKQSSKVVEICKNQKNSASQSVVIPPWDKRDKRSPEVADPSYYFIINTINTVYTYTFDDLFFIPSSVASCLSFLLTTFTLKLHLAHLITS